MSTNIKLSCWIENQDAQDVFTLSIPRSHTISELRDAIVEQDLKAFHDIISQSLRLYKVRDLQQRALMCHSNSW